MARVIDLILSVAEGRVEGVPETWENDMANKDGGGGQRRVNRRSDEVRETEEEAETSAADAVKERHDKLSDDVDSMLDEIDEVLEENAEDFVRSYVQKGGE